jgi:hypothetical protein
MGKSSLPPGFRFHPTDVELIMYYLKRKILRKKLCVEAISEVKIYNFSPWDLPDKSCLKSKDREWFFFCPKELKYPNGSRSKRATETGYWKTTGNDRSVLYNERVVGKVRTLVFYTGHAPKGTRTDWVMHEYRMENSNAANEAGFQNDAYVVCKLFEKSGPGPKNGAQYGAPFNEEEWSEDDEVETPAVTELVHLLPGPANSSEPTSQLELFKAGPSITTLRNEADNDDIVALLDMFTDVDTLPLRFKDNNNKNNEGTSEKKEGEDIFDGLGNLNEQIGYKFSSIEDSFLELDDLNTPLDLQHHHPIDDEGAEFYNSYDVNFDYFYQRGGE